MTREQAEKEIRDNFTEVWADGIIKSLEQDTVSKEVYDHEYYLRKEFEVKIDKLERAFDKIIAEIAEIQLIGYATVDGKREIASRAVLEILDKYKAESEVDNGNDN